MTTFKPVKDLIDIDRVANLAKEIWTEHYTSIIGIDQVNYMLKKFQSKNAIETQITEDGYQYYLIKNNTNDIGYISVKEDNSALFLSKIYITKTYRGQGFGKIAMNFIESLANELNCTKIYLTVNKYNTNSIKAYQNIGFVNIEELIIDIGNDYIMDDYKMEKIL